MRIRDFAYSAAFIAILSASTAIVTPAMAQKGRYLEPSTSWAVTRVGKNQGQGSEYCALARRFDQNTIMTVARNANSETSFALDFQASRLTIGQTVEVVLDPGAGNQRAYSVQPVSEKAFVIRLGNDDAFFDSLARTGFLRVEVEDQQFSFNLQDIDQGRNQLETCIASSVAPAAGGDDSIFYDVNAPKQKPVVTALADMPSAPEISGEGKDIASLREEIERLRQKQAEITDLVSTSGREVRNERVASENADVISDLRERVSSLEAEKQDLEAALAEAGQRKDMAISAQVSEETINRLQGENDSLRKMVREFEVRLGEHSALLSEVEGLRKSNEDLRHALSSSKELAEDERNGAQTLQEAVAALEVQNAELSAQLETAKTGLMNFASQVSDIEEIRKTNEILKQQLADSEQKQKSIEEMTAKLEAIEAEKVALSEAAKAAEERATMDLQLKHELESNIVALKTENEELQKNLKNASNSKEEVELLTSKIEALNQQNETLNEQLKSADEQYEQSAEAHKAALAELEAKIAKLNEEKSVQDKQLVELSALTIELGTLRQQNEALQAKLDESKKTEDTIAELHGQIKSLAAGNEDLQKEIERVRAEKQGEYAAQIETLTFENEGLKARLELQKSQISQLEELTKELEQLRSEKTAMLEDLEELEMRDAKSSENFAALAQEKNDLIAAQEDMKARYESLKQEQSKLVAEKDSISKEKDLLVEENETLRQKIAETTGTEADLITQLRSEKEALELSLANEKKSFEELRASIDATSDQKTGEIQSYKAQLAEKEKAMDDMIALIAEKQTEIDGRVSEVEALESELEQMRVGHEKVVATLESELAAKQETLAALEIKLSESVASLEPAGNDEETPVAPQDDASSLVSQMQDLASENERLRTELQSIALQQGERESELIELRADNDALRRKIESILQTAQQTGAPAGLVSDEQLAELQAQLDDALEQNKALQAHIVELESLQQTQVAVAADGSAEPEENVPFGPSVKSPDPLVAELNQLVEQLKAENETLKQQISGYDQQQQRITELESALSAAQEENKMLREKIEEQALMLQAQAESGLQQVSLTSDATRDTQELENARQKIAALEKKLSQADIEKQRAMENLAKSYMQLKSRMQGASMLPASYRDANSAAAMPAQEANYAVASAERPSELDPRAGGDIDSEDELLPIPQQQVEANQLPREAEPYYDSYPPSQAGAVPQGSIEAQMYEAQEMRSLEQQAGASRAVQAQQTQEDIQIRQSQDPYAGMHIEDANGNVISEADPVMRESLMPDHTVVGQETVNWNQPGSRQADSSNYPQEAAVTQVSVAQVSQGIYTPTIAIEELLKRAQIAPASGVQMVQEASGQGRVAYQWQAGDVFGTAELLPLNSDANFDSAVKTYLDRTQSRCGGEFAVVPYDTRQVGDVRVDSYEIACVGSQVQASASLLFFNQAGTFAILTHESGIDKMDSAMTMRDRIMKTLVNAS